MHDSVTNSSTCLGNTTETFFRISSLLVGHNYTFSVRARCLLNNQLCGEAAVLLYDELGKGAGQFAVCYMFCLKFCCRVVVFCGT